MLFFSFTSILSSSTVRENSFQFLLEESDSFTLVLRAFSPSSLSAASWLSSANLSMTILRSFATLLFQRTSRFFLTLDFGLRLEESRMAICRLSSFRLRQKVPEIPNISSIFIHRKDRLHCHRHEAEEQAHSPGPQPLITLCSRPNLSQRICTAQYTPDR